MSNAPDCLTVPETIIFKEILNQKYMNKVGTKNHSINYL